MLLKKKTASKKASKFQDHYNRAHIHERNTLVYNHTSLSTTIAEF